MQVVTPLIAFMEANPDLKKDDFATVRCMMSGAAPVGQSLIEKIIAKVDSPNNYNFIQVYKKLFA